MEEPKATHKEIWLEVSNVAFYAKEGGYMAIQLKNDLDADRTFRHNGDLQQFKVLLEALKEKRAQKQPGLLPSEAIADLKYTVFSACRSSEADEGTGGGGVAGGPVIPLGRGIREV